MFVLLPGVAVGTMAGDCVGCVSGFSVGVPLGFKVGIVLGLAVGFDFGFSVSVPLGFKVGIGPGLPVGAVVEFGFGVAFGSEVGIILGLVVGFDTGSSLGAGSVGVGLGLGVTVGSSGSPMYFTVIPLFLAYLSAREFLVVQITKLLEQSEKAKSPMLVTFFPSISPGITNSVSLPEYFVIHTPPSSPTEYAYPL